MQEKSALYGRPTIAAKELEIPVDLCQFLSHKLLKFDDGIIIST